MNVLRKIGYGVLGVWIVIFLVVLLGSIMPVLGYQTLIVTSGSMEPVITTGSVILVRRSNTYEVGDIITFTEPKKEHLPTTHRIVGVHEDDAMLGYETKGDANNDADIRRVPHKDVIGRVMASAPGFGYLLAFARSWYGLVLLVGVPFVLVVLGEITTIRSSLQENNNDK